MKINSVEKQTQRRKHGAIREEVTGISERGNERDETREAQERSKWKEGKEPEAGHCHRTLGSPEERGQSPSPTEEQVQFIRAQKQKEIKRTLNLKRETEPDHVKAKELKDQNLPRRWKSR